MVMYLPRKSVDINDDEQLMLTKIGKDLGIRSDANVVRYLIKEYFRNHLDGE